MADTRTVAVVGATGAQGGGLVRAIVDDPSAGFRARALTGDPHAAKASGLAGRGADIGRCAFGVSRPASPTWAARWA
ncbi:NmrA family NAD(P)-binding protein [Ramlibacter sp. AW1]|uniref:NmrA family NAD(P)-binding protein n=1 Tax=Ramlibacter aurantiacus TaxID=2801330 RepID=A0A936ZQI0_9BURK|nr:NmrA family NAD(P)-binding protein [Ramlibacter aurantiacus]